MREERRRAVAMKFFALVLTLALALSAAAYAQGQPSRIIMQIPNPMGPIHQFLLYGQQRKFFEREGVDLRIVVVPASVGPASLLSGETHFSSQFGTLLYLGMKAAQVKNIMLIFARAPWHLMAGPGIHSAKDLKGKSLGIFSLGQANHYAAMRAIAHLGLDPTKDVQYMALGGNTGALSALKQGAVQAALVTSPWHRQSLQFGAKELLFTANILEFPNSGVGTTEKLLKESPQLAKRMITATLKTIQDLRRNPGEATSFLRQLLKVEHSDAAESYAEMAASIIPDGVPSNSGIQALMEAGKMSGAIRGDVKPDSAMDLSLLKEVQRELGLK
jgi:ABC-type nitrate/sulfonate/bicarbonate transport system substrate-binding protein